MILRKMPSLQSNLILIALGFTLAACATSKPVEQIKLQKIEIKRPEPIVPDITPLDLRDVKWIIITEENYAQVFESLKGTNPKLILFAVTSDGYKNISLNDIDKMSVIRQYQRVIAIYKKSYQ